MYTDKLFTGQREITGLGIYHYGSRFYSPKLGRFLSADSIIPNAANPQDFNRYSYVRNNPLRYTDPSGHAQYEDPYTSSTGICKAGDTSCNWVGTKLTKPKPSAGGGPLITVVPSGPSSGGLVTVPITSSSGLGDNSGVSVATDIGTGIGEFGQVVSATSQLQTVNVGTQVIIYGTQANRGAAGLNPFTNNINIANQGRLFSPLRSMRGSLGSYFTWAGIFVGVAFNGADYADGRMSGTRFAAASTVDLMSGLAIAAISGAIVGGTAAGLASAGIGAIPGAIIGAAVGIGFAIAASQTLETSGINDAATDWVESQYEILLE
jgi:RHS repeat-associated protein